MATDPNISKYLDHEKLNNTLYKGFFFLVFVLFFKKFPPPSWSSLQR